MDNRGSFSQSRNRLPDRDMLQDLLLTEKYMSSLYDHAIMEATDDTVRDTFIALQQGEYETAQTLFDFLQNRGWSAAGADRHRHRSLAGRRFSDLAAPGRRTAETGSSRRFGQNFASRGLSDQPPARAGARGRPGAYAPRSPSF